MKRKVCACLLIMAVILSNLCIGLCASETLEIIPIMLGSEKNVFTFSIADAPKSIKSVNLLVLMPGKTAADLESIADFSSEQAKKTLLYFKQIQLDGYLTTVSFDVAEDIPSGEYTFIAATDESSSEFSEKYIRASEYNNFIQEKIKPAASAEEIKNIFESTANASEMMGVKKEIFEHVKDKTSVYESMFLNKDDLWNAFNLTFAAAYIAQGEGSDDGWELLLKNITEFNIDKDLFNMFENMSREEQKSVLKSGELSGVTKDTLKPSFETAILLKRIGNVNTTQIQMFIDKYAGRLGISDSKRSEYLASPNITAAYSAVAGKMYDTKEAFAAAFAAAINAPVSSGGGASSGGGNKTSSVLPKSINSAIGAYTAEQPAEENMLFADISDHWAKNEIYALAGKKIISGYPNGYFCPEQGLTRAQLAKMLVVCADIEPDYNSAGFEDVAATDWYYPYVNALKNKKLISGTDENTFDGENFISRQDASLMIYNIFKSEIYGEKSIVFSDEADINGYALGAVKALGAASVINGIEDGKFMPRENLTRAQAAKILYNIIFREEKTNE